MSGAFMLLLWTAGLLTAGLIIIVALAFRDFSARETVDVLLRSAVVMIIAVLGWTWLDYSILRERLAERRALDMRTGELTARAIAPGSALACLNAIENETIEAACEQAVFASPQAVAAAIAYVDARLILLADGVEYASRDRSYAGELELPRRALEADRFGIVAHVLASRGCKLEACSAFKLLRDTSRVQANLKEGAFEARLAPHAVAWASNNPANALATTLPTAATAVAPQPPTGPPSATSALTPPSSSAGPRLNFPSSASIPPVSIMAPEPTGSVPPNTGESAAPPGSERQPPPRRQSASKPAQAKPLPPPPRVPPAATSSPTPPPNLQ